MTGCNSQLIAATYLGGTSVIMPRLDLAATPTVLARERITLMATVPAIYALLLGRSDLTDADVGHLRWAGVRRGADRDVVGRCAAVEVRRRRGVQWLWDDSTSSLTTLLPDCDALGHADSVGYAVPSVDIAVKAVGDDTTTGSCWCAGQTS